jgi:hypothetical protein
MSDFGMIMLCATIAGPLIAMAWAMKPRQCPHCGASVEPDEHAVHMFIGR